MKTNFTNLLKKLPVNRSHPTYAFHGFGGQALGVGLLVLSLAVSAAAPLCAMEKGAGGAGGAGERVP